MLFLHNEEFNEESQRVMKHHLLDPISFIKDESNVCWSDVFFFFISADFELQSCRDS